MIESDRYVIIVLKASGKDERNSKYVVKLVIIVDYRVKQSWNNEIPVVKMIWRNYGIEKAWYG